MPRNLLFGLVGAGGFFLFGPVLLLVATGQPLSRNLALTLIFIACVLSPSIAIAAMGFSSIAALGRNPTSAPKILTAMTINLIFIEAIAIVAFLVVWQLFAPKG